MNTQKGKFLITGLFLGILLPVNLLAMNVVDYNNHGNTYHEMGEYDKAIAGYTKVIELDPKFAK